MDELKGTYVHKLLIPHILCWVSAKFAIKCSKIINDFFVNEAIREKDLLL